MSVDTSADYSPLQDCSLNLRYDFAFYAMRSFVEELDRIAGRGKRSYSAMNDVEGNVCFTLLQIEDLLLDQRYHTLESLC